MVTNRKLFKKKPHSQVQSPHALFAFFSASDNIQITSQGNQKLKANSTQNATWTSAISWSQNLKRPDCHQCSVVASVKVSTDEDLCASSISFICRSACSLSQALMPIIISSIVPVVPKNTRGAKDFRFIPTGIASRAPATEKTHVPRALQ